ncbi:MAG: PIG-L family deacetylase [Bacteroidia bacterium]|nr:PIG-L family deacetylase [Ignavibacteriaceae bacterium]MCK6615935.1 PIG-L family deacetylase [Ignavibacteriaceae bacterium]MCK6648620.1 PIG-L family deacetylase [Bacteroidia bacterium]
MKTKTKVLVVAPHCDDEILGCGGTIAKHVSNGNEVYVAIVTNGNLGAPELFSKAGTEKVRSEALAAHKYLGIKNTFFLDFPAPRLDSVPSYQLSLKFSEIIGMLKIETVYLPHRGDIHNDHGISFNSALVACRPINSNSVKTIYAYETLSETEWAPPFGDDSFVPTHFEVIDDYIEKKTAAFTLYTTQVREFPHPRSVKGIQILANKRGMTISRNFAEAFMTIRSIEY